MDYEHVQRIFPCMYIKLETIYETSKLLPKNTIMIYTIMKLCKKGICGL
jgi:hypothetical protein